MALQTSTTIKIGQTVITNFSGLKIIQKIHDHHTFSLEIRQDLLVEEFRSVMPVSQRLYGEKISIEIKPIDGLDDPMANANPKNYIMQFYGIVTGVSMKKSNIDNIEESFLIEGCSTSILLENGPESNSFTAMTLSDIVNFVKSSYNIDMQVRPFYKEVLSYTVQYNESCFAFLNRLAMRYGQYFYDNGRVLIFGDSADVIQPDLIYGVNMQEFKYSIKLLPVSFTVLENDNRDGNYSKDDTLNYRKELNGFHQNFINKSNAVFNKNTIIQLNQNAAGGSGRKTGAVYAQNKMRAVSGSLMEVNALSEVPGITVGNNVKITGVDKQQESTYRVTEIVHTCDDGGGYENHFKAVNTSDSVFSPKTNPDLIPYCGSQTAVVIANADPEGLSGIQVQMPWQKLKGQTTPYIPIVQEYGGEAKGSHWIPEIGETVFVDFQGNNAEMPIVVGTMSSRKQKSGYSTENNDIKALHTRSNNLLLMNDAQGSVLLQDASKSFIDMDGRRKIEINTDELHINVKKLLINASQSTEITTNDYVLNALTRIYVLSKTMQQKISGFMNLFSGTALINSSDKIDIEARTAKLHGSETALLHSDKEAVVNSTGTAKMHGAQGNSLTNKAKNVEVSNIDADALAVVYFRPLDSWKGEFGFDWLREKDNGLTAETDYESIIESGYKDEKTNLNKQEAYAQLKQEYQKITMTRKKAQTGGAFRTDYFVPYLTLFSQEFVDTMPNDTFLKPPYCAELRMLVDIDENLEKLAFEYDDAFFNVSTNRAIEPAKTADLKQSSANVIIECLKDLDRDHEIIVYAYPKNTAGSPKTELQTITERKIAGKIIVLRNDEKTRKEEKIVLVEVKTNISGIPVTGESTGKFDWKDELNLYNSLHQALIVPKIEKTIFDLSNNPDFKDNGKHIFGEYINYGLEKDGKIFVYIQPFTDCKTAFFNVKDQNAGLINEKYKDYFTVFKFGLDANLLTVTGSVIEIGIKNVFIFKLADFNNTTTAHETLHGLGLWHTHKADSHPDKKYTFNAKTTTNIMSYSYVSYSSWHWQWKIINPNIN